MSELYEVSQEIEKLFQLHAIPESTLEKLLSKRQELLDCLEEVSEEEARRLMAQDARLLQTCEAVKESLGRQVEAVKERNKRSRISKSASKYFDSRC